MSTPDPYRTLGVDRHAGSEEIRAAFRSAVRRAHPDTAADPVTDGGVRDVMEAYRLLIDPAARARYDASSPGTRVNGDSAARARPPGGGVCGACGGGGAIDVAVTCPSCGGRAEITSLEPTRARVFRCRTCRGRGRLRTRRSCAACHGSGISVT